MKKNLLPIIAVFTTSMMVIPSFAYALNVKPKGTIDFVIGVFNVIEKDGVREKLEPVQDNVISRSNPSRNFCWALVSINLGDKAKVVEKFTSPQNGVFSAENMSIVSNKDKTQHTITSEESPTPDDSQFDRIKRLERCWSFGSEDPLGKYSLTVTIDGVTYATGKFILTE